MIIDNDEDDDGNEDAIKRMISSMLTVKMMTMESPPLPMFSLMIFSKSQTMVCQNNNHSSSFNIIGWIKCSSHFNNV